KKYFFICFAFIHPSIKHPQSILLLILHVMYIAVFHIPLHRVTHVPKNRRMYLRIELVFEVDR
ncbi:hypothetical protein ACJX0J_024285, partial [Zea mays]